MRQLLTTSLAWLIGVGVYVLAAVAWKVYDGFQDMVVLPACGAIASAVVVGLGLVAGLALGPTRLGRRWRASWAWAAVATVGSVGLLGFGSAAGLTSEYTHPSTGERFQSLHPAAALGGYVLLLFAVTHWPLGKPPEAESGEGPMGEKRDTTGKKVRPRTAVRGKRYRCAKCRKRSPRPVTAPAPWYCPNCLREKNTPPS